MNAEYVFPDMDIAELKKALPESGRITTSNPTLALINASFAVISIPFRIVSTIEAEDDAAEMELLWACPASTASET